MRLYSLACPLGGSLGKGGAGLAPLGPMAEVCVLVFFCAPVCVCVARLCVCVFAWVGVGCILEAFLQLFRNLWGVSLCVCVSVCAYQCVCVFVGVCVCVCVLCFRASCVCVCVCVLFGVSY